MTEMSFTEEIYERVSRLYAGMTVRGFSKLCAHFGIIRPPVSVWSGHPFQYHPANRFGIIRPPMTA